MDTKSFPVSVACACPLIENRGWRNEKSGLRDLTHEQAPIMSPLQILKGLFRKQINVVSDVISPERADALNRATALVEKYYERIDPNTRPSPKSIMSALEEIRFRIVMGSSMYSTILIGMTPGLAQSGERVVFDAMMAEIDKRNAELLEIAKMQDELKEVGIDRDFNEIRVSLALCP